MAPDANAAARGLFERAVALDPDYGLAHAYLALAIFAEEWGDAAAERLASCLELASRAVALDPGESRCHRVLAMILLSAREFDRADQHSEPQPGAEPQRRRRGWPIAPTFCAFSAGPMRRCR